MKKTLKSAFTSTLPVLAGYLVLGFGFGILLKTNGYGILWALVMSLFIYAGAMQYVAIGLLTSSASLITVALTTLLVNARHLFYGISMLKKYKHMGKRKAYLIFALTDETYSLLCEDHPNIPAEAQKNYCLFVSLLNHAYWITGSVLGAVVGTFVKFNTEGIDFVLTALFITVFIEQWITAKQYTSAIIGVAATAICLIIFGSEKFLIPAMLVILLSLCLNKGERKHG